MAYNIGYKLRWFDVEPKNILLATIKSVVDTDDLRNIIFECLEKINK